MAATTVNDFYKPYASSVPDDARLLRLSRRATIGWGIVQLGVALGAQFMERSVLDAGLAVLSFASGAVLGAFVIATLMPRVGEPEALAGMGAGLATMTAVWAFTPLAWTWYVFVGALATCATAWTLSAIRRSSS
jgi:SSS family solute:Na+ symporter